MPWHSATLEVLFKAFKVLFTENGKFRGALLNRQFAIQMYSMRLEIAIIDSKC